MNRELTKDWRMNISKHELLADIVAAVPDIGDKAAREAAIARTAYNAGQGSHDTLMAALANLLRRCEEELADPMDVPEIQAARTLLGLGA